MDFCWTLFDLEKYLNLPLSLSVHHLTQGIIPKEELKAKIAELNNDLLAEGKKVAIDVEDCYKPG